MYEEHRSCCRSRRNPWSSALVVIAGVLIVAALSGHAVAGDGPRGGAAIPPVPQSLAALYPPAAAAPVHLFAMLELQDAFSGIVVDVLEDDTKGARETFVLFRDRYQKAAGLVPEWRSAYPDAPVSALDAALASGKREETMGAIDTVGGVCHRCHVTTMVPVQQRYRWGNFAAQVVKDPLAGDTPPFGIFKLRLASVLTGVTHDLRQGQVEQARRQFEAFSARFDALRGSCVSCHATPRRSFVDRNVQQLVEDLRKALDAPAPTAEAAAELAARIGQASCSGCHLVHVPAATAQAAQL